MLKWYHHWGGGGGGGDLCWNDSVLLEVTLSTDCRICLANQNTYLLFPFT